jgi:hypothetical protein
VAPDLVLATAPLGHGQRAAGGPGPDALVTAAVVVAVRGAGEDEQPAAGAVAAGAVAVRDHLVAAVAHAGGLDGPRIAVVEQLVAQRDGPDQPDHRDGAHQHLLLPGLAGLGGRALLGGERLGGLLACSARSGPGPRPASVAADADTGAARRRTFAIISHPDAGKTTLTEKFLLYSGAVQGAGAVHARGGRRSATAATGWSSSSSAASPSPPPCCSSPTSPHVSQPAGHAGPPRLQRGHLPRADRRRRSGHGARRGEGHRGADAQAVPGLPLAQPADHHVPQQVRPARSRARWSCSTRSSSRSRCGPRPSPGRWASAATSAGSSTVVPGDYIGLTRTARGATEAPRSPTSSTPAAADTVPAGRRTAMDESSSLLRRRRRRLRPAILPGRRVHPLFIGSALTNFGVRTLLDARGRPRAPADRPCLDIDGAPRALDAPFSAFVFKVQANMDPAHRDRIAFARICSGTSSAAWSSPTRAPASDIDHQVRHHRVRPRP